MADLVHSDITVMVSGGAVIVIMRFLSFKYTFVTSHSKMLCIFLLNMLTGLN